MESIPGKFVKLKLVSVNVVDDVYDELGLFITSRPRPGKRQLQCQEMKVVGLHPRNQYQATPHTALHHLTLLHHTPQRVSSCIPPPLPLPLPTKKNRHRVYYSLKYGESLQCKQFVCFYMGKI